jgi:GNAT superfamily N-acetyltransferase
MLSRMVFATVEDDSSKREARELLTSRLASSGLTKDNSQLISKLLGFSKGELHCHLSKRPLAAKELKAFRCAIGTDARGRVVVAACFRHVERPRRASASQCNFTELLLLAVDQREERKGLGRSMVAYVHECARAAGSERLIVVSNGHTFWRHPGIRFVDLEPNHNMNVFVPWSVGIKLLVRRIEAAGPEAAGPKARLEEGEQEAAEAPPAVGQVAAPRADEAATVSGPDAAAGSSATETGRAAPMELEAEPDADSATAAEGAAKGAVVGATVSGPDAAAGSSATETGRAAPMELEAEPDADSATAAEGAPVEANVDDEEDYELITNLLLRLEPLKNVLPHAPAQSIVPGEHVEVRGMEEGFLDSWYQCLVLEVREARSTIRLRLRYLEFQEEDGSFWEDWFDQQNVRPMPPDHDPSFILELKKGQPLEMDLDGGWWEVEMSRRDGPMYVVTSKRYKVQHVVPLERLRPSPSSDTTALKKTSSAQGDPQRFELVSEALVMLHRLESLAKGRLQPLPAGLSGLLGGLLQVRADGLPLSAAECHGLPLIAMDGH